MSHYNIEEFFNLTRIYPQYPSHHNLQYAQSFSSFADTGTSTIEQGVEYSIQDFPPAPIDFLNWDNSFLTSVVTSSSAAQASANLPTASLQNSLSGMLPHSYLDIVSNSSRTLPVATPVPVPHAARTRAALRTMLSFGDKGSVYHIPLTSLNWYERYLQDKEDTLDNSAAGGELLKISNEAFTQVDLDNHILHSNVQAAVDYNALAHTGNDKKTTSGRSKLIIPPISPSTLMALTEPCLMAWCTAFDDNVAEPDSSAYFPLPSSDYNNYVDTKSSAVYNVWGY